MPVNIEDRESLKQEAINESDHEYSSSFIGLVDQSESEIQWVKLHQMFDR